MGKATGKKTPNSARRKKQANRVKQDSTESRSVRWAKVVRDSVIIAIIGSVCGLTYNLANPRAIPYVRPERDPSLADYEVNLTVAKAMFDGGLLFVDSREHPAYARGHIKCAVNIPYDKHENNMPLLEDMLDGNLDKPFVIYCDGSNCNASTILAESLLGAGFNGVKIYFGGWDEWIAAGYATGKPGE